MSAPPPIPNSPKIRKKAKTKAKSKPRNLRRELTVFLVFFSILLAVGAYFAFTGMRDNNRELWGFPIYLALSVPLGLLALLHLASGLLVALVPAREVCVLGGISSTLLALLYFAFMVTSTGQSPINLMTLLFIGIPSLYWSRAALYMAQKPEETPDEED